MTIADTARILESHGLNIAEIAAYTHRRPSYVEACLMRDSPQTARIERDTDRPHGKDGRFVSRAALEKA